MKRRPINPVAKAVARQKLKTAVLDQKLAIFIKDQGEECAELVTGIAMTLSLICYAYELDKRLDISSVDFRIMQGGLSACHQLSLTGSWDVLQAPAISYALDIAEKVFPTVDGKCVDEALARITS